MTRADSPLGGNPVRRRRRGGAGRPAVPAAERLIVVSGLFDQIPRGTITLSVPLRDDVIQLGVRDAPDRGALRVRKGRRTATVERTDHRPVQAAVVHEPDAPWGAATHTVTNVFHRPVQTLRLERRCRGGEFGWEVAVTAAELTDPCYLRQFIEVIGAFGAAKRPESRIPRRWLHRSQQSHC